MVGGNLIAGWGGKLSTWGWTGFQGTAGTPKAFNTQTLDVARWQIHYDRIAPPISYSGCFGSLRRRQVCDDWKVYCKVWWDAVNFPDGTLRNTADGMALKLTISNANEWTRVGASFTPYYAAPLCTLSVYDISDPSEGDEDGIVYANAMIEADSLLYFVSTAALQTNYNNYVTSLQNEFMLPSN